MKQTIMDRHLVKLAEENRGFVVSAVKGTASVNDLVGHALLYMQINIPALRVK